MKRIIKLTESDFTRIVKRVINESDTITKSMIDDAEHRLTPIETKILRMTYVDNLSPSKIADMIDYTVIRVKGVLKNAERRLKNPPRIPTESEIIEKKKQKFKSDVGKIIRQYSVELSPDIINDVLIDIRMNSYDLR